MKVIVGLGNPGKKYSSHRHNLGQWVVEALAKQSKWRWTEQSLYWEAWGSWKGEEIFLVKPGVYMNESGKTIGKLKQDKGMKLEDLVVIHDDLDLKLGAMRWAFGSGHGGHNGIRSTIEALGSKEFSRLRIGIGRPPVSVDPAEYVLESFVGEDLTAAEAIAATAAKSVHDFVEHGLQWVQNHYH